MLSGSSTASPRGSEQWSQSHRFTTLLDDMRKREEEREISYLEVIHSLEDENKTLAGELDAMREAFSAAQERHQMELQRVTQLIAEVREVADEERRARNVVEAQARAAVRAALTTAVDSNTALLRLAFAQEEEYRSITDASCRCASLRSTADVIRQSEERERDILQSWEKDAMGALRSKHDMSWRATVTTSELQSRIASTSELAADLTARGCLVEKEDLVLQEDVEWGRLVDAEEFCRMEIVAALKRFASREAALFWECCLEEAREVLRTVVPQNEVERSLLESCSEHDLPCVIQSFLDDRGDASASHSGSPAASLHLWQTRVLDPILLAAGGTMSVVQLIASISLAVPSQEGAAEEGAYDVE